jgi:hypothetical protein
VKVTASPPPSCLRICCFIIMLFNELTFHLCIARSQCVQPPNGGTLQYTCQVDIEAGYGPNGRGSISGRGKGSFSFPQSPDRLWGQLSLLLNGYWGHFPRGCSGYVVKLTTHFHLVSRWSYTSTSTYIYMVWCLLNQAQSQLRLYFYWIMHYCNLIRRSCVCESVSMYI